MMNKKPFAEAVEQLVKEKHGILHPVEVSWPTERDEDWRFTRLSGLMKRGVHLPSFETVQSSDLNGHAILKDAHRLVFVNGHFAAELSEQSDVAGLTIGYETVTPMKKVDAFTDVSDQLSEKECVIRLAKNSNPDKPVYIMHVVTDSSGEALVMPRIRIKLAPFSKATIVEDFLDLTGGAYVQIPVSSTSMEEQSHLVYVKIQRQNRHSYFLNRSYADISRGAHYESYTVMLGGHFSRNDVQATQISPEIQCTLDGLVLLSGNQFSDTHSVMDHAKPHGESHQLHKVILLGHAHSVFNGKIFVRQDAQKTNSFQENRTLLLSHTATVNTKPQLEIFADDVKCSHGATIGQLEDEQLFYLKSRGIGEVEARQLLIHAFAGEVINKIPLPELRAFLDHFVSRFVPSPEEATV